MLKEIVMILGAIGCIFLLVPMFWLYPWELFKEVIITICLVGVLLVYSAFDVKKMLSNKQKDKARNFIVIFILAIFLSYIVVFQILPFIAPKLLL